MVLVWALVYVLRFDVWWMGLKEGIVAVDHVIKASRALALTSPRRLALPRCGS